MTIKDNEHYTIGYGWAKIGQDLIVQGNTDNYAILILDNNGVPPLVDVLVHAYNKTSSVQKINETRILGLLGFSKHLARTATIRALNEFPYLTIPQSFYELVQPYFLHDMLDIVANIRPDIDFGTSLQLDSEKETIIENVKLVYLFQKSMKSKDFSIHYQPLLDLNTNEIVGYEALTRWSTAPKGVYPDQYFGQVEKTPISVLFFDRLFEQVLTDIAQYDLPTVSLNVSGFDIRQENYVSRILGRIKDHGLTNDRIKIELTERADMHDPNVKKNVRKLQEAGIPICLDDFGEGVSSVKLVPELSPDIIKIDKSWLNYDPRELKALIVYSLESGCDVVVEGIETLEDLESVKEMGANIGQGFYICRPAPIETFFENEQEHKTAS